jgi:nucleosome assembly protein 1-like 1
LEFQFAPNEFFTNEVLTKKYYLKNEVDPNQDDVVYSKAEGCSIDWKTGKDLTTKVELRKQRHKNTQKTRVVKKVVQADSWFNFFKHPQIPDEEDEADDDVDYEELENQLMEDFEMADHFTEAIIPRALDWFTGKALESYGGEVTGLFIA